jgi:hypothetical protein
VYKRQRSETSLRLDSTFGLYKFLCIDSSLSFFPVKMLGSGLYMFLSRNFFPKLNFELSLPKQAVNFSCFRFTQIGEHNPTWNVYSTSNSKLTTDCHTCNALYLKTSLHIIRPPSRNSWILFFKKWLIHRYHL